MSTPKKTPIFDPNFGLASLTIGSQPAATTSETPRTGQADVDSLADMSDLLKSFKAKSAAENARFQDVTDSEYWIAVCFQSRAQKEAFLRALDLLADGDKYLDGELVAEKIGVKLDRQAPRKATKVGKKFMALVANQ